MKNMMGGITFQKKQKNILRTHTLLPPLMWVKIPLELKKPATVDKPIAGTEEKAPSKVRGMTKIKKLEYIKRTHLLLPPLMWV